MSSIMEKKCDNCGEISRIYLGHPCDYTKKEYENLHKLFFKINLCQKCTPKEYYAIKSLNFKYQFCKKSRLISYVGLDINIYL